jgi:hypothetical protein
MLAVHRGFWPGRHGLSFQDIVLASLEAAA